MIMNKWSSFNNVSIGRRGNVNCVFINLHHELATFLLKSCLIDVKLEKNHLGGVDEHSQVPLKYWPSNIGMILQSKHPCFLP